MKSAYTSSPFRFLLLLGGIVTLLLGRDFSVHPIVLIVQLLVLDMLLKESTIFNTPYFRIFYLLFSVWLIGALFTILHWPWGTELISIPIIIGAALYTLRTIQKPAIRFLDVAKWIWVASFAVSIIFINWHLPDSALMSYLPTASFFLLMLAFFLTPKSTTPEAEMPQEDRPIDQL